MHKEGDSMRRLSRKPKQPRKHFAMVWLIVYGVLITAFLILVVLYSH